MEVEQREDGGAVQKFFRSFRFRIVLMSCDIIPQMSDA